MTFFFSQEVTLAFSKMSYYVFLDNAFLNQFLFFL